MHLYLENFLISTDNNGTFLTYTVKRESFTVGIERFNGFVQQYIGYRCGRANWGNY